ncbi:MAG: InlB B-repeat-containing protein, partial [Lachnospiraceae bacterium]|nr:InlB B-repeat-containing protein [Lachnospiraceae bacterium]
MIEKNKFKISKTIKSILAVCLTLVMIVTIAPSGVSIITKNKKLSKVAKVEAAGIPTAPSVSAPTEPNWTTFTSNATDFEQLQNDISAQATPGSSVSIIVANDITDGSFQVSGNHVLKIPNNSKVYLTGGAKQVTLDFAANGQTSRGGISVSGDATLYLSNIKLTGGNRTDNNGPGGGILIGSGLDDKTDASTVVMKDGTEITGNTSGIGGGVYVSDNSKLYMLGGVISNNTSTSRGAGVYLHNGGQLIMKAGAIRNNTANGGYGGGVAVDKDGSTDRNSYFIMEAGTISGNISPSHDGAGVAVAPGTTFDLVHGRIAANQSSGNKGGGVWVQDATFNMWNGRVSSNDAWYGGGVQVETSDTSGYSYDNATKSVFNMYGGTIGGEGTGNTGANPGILLGAPTENGFGRNGGTFNMYGGEISYNIGIKNNKMGFGIASYNNGIVNVMGNSDVSYNYSTDKTGSGGGIGVNTGKLNIGNDVTIKNNDAYNGGGIYVYNGNLNLNGGIISGNTTDKLNGHGWQSNKGGGIYLNRTVYTIQDTEIKDNSSSSGGAMYIDYCNDTSNTITNVNLSHNTSGFGGAIFTNQTYFNIANSIIDSNTCDDTFNAGGIELYYTNGVIEHVTVSNNKAGYSAGILIADSTVDINNSKVDNNTAVHGTGGIGIAEASVVNINDSIISNNKAPSTGGGISSTNSYYRGDEVVSIKNTQIIGNTVDANNGLGGGIYSNYSKFDLENVTLASNSAYKGGGYYTSSQSEIHFTGDNIIKDNVATTDGGGIYDDYWTSTNPNFNNIYLENNSTIAFSGNIANKTNLIGTLPDLGDWSGDILSTSIDNVQLPSGVVKDQIDDFAQNNDVKKLIVFNNNDINMTSSTHYYTVKFDSNGGSDVPYQLVSDDGSSTVTKPADPTKDEYTFAGW